jgi:hypothetical protein
MALVAGFYWLTLASRAGRQAENVNDLFAIVEVIYASVGAFLASRRPTNPIGWLFLGIGFVQTVNIFCGAYARYALITEPGSLPGGALASWLEAWTWIVGFTGFSFIMLLFPSGSLPSPRWRWVAWLAVAGIVLTALTLAVGSWPQRGLPLLEEVDEPTSTAWIAVIVTGFAILAAATLMTLVSVLVRFRRSRGDERQQIKWFLCAAAFAVATAASTFAGTVTPEWLLDVGLAGVAIAVAIAVLKYRLYDIDVVIRRTLVYGVATAALAGVYLAVVLLFQRVFSSFAGGGDLAIAASTLIAFALFRPVRARVQTLVDRRFYRRKYDAQHTLETFASCVREEVELTALETELAATVDQTMRPAHISVWLRQRAT